jgi:hypothetical protein
MFFEEEWGYGLKRKFDGSEGPWDIQLPPMPQQRKKFLKNILRGEQDDVLGLTR